MTTQSEIWHRLRGALFGSALLVIVLGMMFAWGVDAQASLAAGGPLDGSAKYADRDAVPPGGTINYTIVLSNNVGTLVESVQVVDSLDPRLTLLSANVVPAGAAYWNDTSRGVTFTVPTVSTKVTLTVEAQLTMTAASGDVINNTALISDGVNLVETNVVTFSVSQPPDLQITSPEMDALITNKAGTTLEVLGYAWNDFDPAPFPGVPTLDPIDNLSGSGNYNVVWSTVADATNYELHEASGDGDFAQVYVDSDTSYPVIGQSNGVYHYRVRAFNDQVRPSRWSNVETVTVTAASLLSEEPAASPAPLADGDVVVEVSTDGGDTWEAATVTENAGGWWDWSYDWTLPEADGVRYPIQARATYPGGGGYGEDTITVTVRNSKVFLYLPLVLRVWPPYPHRPVLSAEEPDNTGSYRVSWTYDYTDIPVNCGYELQESEDTSFATVNKYSTTLKNWDFNNKPDGTYYYRVRGCYNWSGQSLWGPWSNVVNVVVSFSRIYNFTSSTEGWEMRRSDEGVSGQLPQALSRDAKLYHLVWGKADYSIMSPLETAPLPPYKLTASVDIVNKESLDDGYNGTVEYTAKQGMTYGIIFGANGDGTCPTTRTQVPGCFYHYYRLLVSYDAGNASLKWQLKRIEYHDEKSEGRGVTLIDWRGLDGYFDDALGWNEWRIEVDDQGSNNIKIYLNNNLVGQATDTNYVSENDLHFGVFLSSTEELGGVATKWEWFKASK